MPARERCDDELPQALLAQFRDEAALVHVHVAQRAGEQRGVECAGLVAEIRVRGDHVAQRVVGDVEAELARLLIDRRFAKKPLQDAAIEADLARFLVGEGPAQPALILLERSLVGDAIFLRRDFRSSDRGDRRRRESAQHVAHAPDDEADDDEPHDDGHDRLADDPLSRVADRSEHLPYSPFRCAASHLSPWANERALSSGARALCIGVAAMITPAQIQDMGEPK